MQQITAEATGGQKVKIVVRLRDRKNLRDLIYEAMDNIGKQ